MRPLLKYILFFFTAVIASGTAQAIIYQTNSDDFYGNWNWETTFYKYSPHTINKIPISPPKELKWLCEEDRFSEIQKQELTNYLETQEVPNIQFGYYGALYLNGTCLAKNIPLGEKLIKLAILDSSLAHYDEFDTVNPNSIALSHITGPLPNKYDIWNQAYKHYTQLDPYELFNFAKNIYEQSGSIGNIISIEKSQYIALTLAQHAGLATKDWSLIRATIIFLKDRQTTSSTIIYPPKAANIMQKAINNLVEEAVYFYGCNLIYNDDPILEFRLYRFFHIMSKRGMAIDTRQKQILRQELLSRYQSDFLELEKNIGDTVYVRGDWGPVQFCLDDFP